MTQVDKQRFATWMNKFHRVVDAAGCEEILPEEYIECLRAFKRGETPEECARNQGLSD